MLNWRDRFTQIAGPGLLGGVTFGDWLALLRDNRFEVSPRFLPRASMITALSLVNLWFLRRERAEWTERVAQAEPLPPLFILGHWRSGTTHLQNLLALDRRFAFPNFYQTLYPRTFLAAEGIGAPLLRLFLPRRRMMDNMRQDVSTPQEDEFATCAMTFCSPYMSFVFPRRRDFYDRYLTFREVPPEVTQRWKDALMLFVRRLTVRHGRPLVLKSPPHTARVRLLLEVFPEARFVHIHRNPYEIFPSTLHLNRRGLRYAQLQTWKGSDEDEEQRVLRNFRAMYDAYFEERRLIPEGRLHEIRFEDLERDPMAELRTLYERLELPEFSAVEPDVRRYLDSLAGFRKNRFPPLSAPQRNRVARECARELATYRYDGYA